MKRTLKHTQRDLYDLRRRKNLSFFFHPSVSVPDKPRRRHVRHIYYYRRRITVTIYILHYIIIGHGLLHGRDHIGCIPKERRARACPYWRRLVQSFLRRDLLRCIFARQIRGERFLCFRHGY